MEYYISIKYYGILIWWERRCLKPPDECSNTCANTSSSCANTTCANTHLSCANTWLNPPKSVLTLERKPCRGVMHAQGRY